MFVRHAFHGTNASEYPNLESVGKKIIEKCGRVAFSCKNIGESLAKKILPT
jgi:hypothetical protein